MTEQEAKKWCSVLNEAEIGDVVAVNGRSVKVTLCDVGENCSRCAFHENGKGCELSACDYTIPCSPFNNTNGKRIIFNKKEIDLFTIKRTRL